MSDRTLLQIYTEPIPHGNTYIVGNRNGIEKLATLLGVRSVDATGGLSCTSDSDYFEVSDGESYQVFVIQVEDSEFERIVLPYTDEYQAPGTQRAHPMKYLRKSKS